MLKGVKDKENLRRYLLYTLKEVLYLKLYIYSLLYKYN
jgi:hypothetical protein